jgi:uncharacterized membrane protein YhfC
MLVMIGLPIFLAIFFTRRFKISWWVVLTGVLTFVVSYALYLPAISGINSLFTKGIISVASDQWFPIVYAIIVGLLVGILQETARWIGFKVLGKHADKYGSAFAAAAGHGGVECIYICIAGLAISFFTVVFYNAGAELAKGTATDTVQYMLSQIGMFWSTPWHYALLPAVERIIGLSTQIFLSTLVWKAVADRSVIWYLLAVLYHMVVEGVSIFLQQSGWNYWAIEGVMTVFLLLNLFMIYRFWKDESEIEKEMDELGDDEPDEDDEENGDDDEDDDDDEEDEDEDKEALEIDHPDEEHTDGESVQD